MMTPSQLSQWAQSRETSIEIANAIALLANDEPAEMQRIWDDPTASEQSTAVALAFAQTTENELYWGLSTHRLGKQL